MTTRSRTPLAPVWQWIDAWFDSAYAVPILLGLFVATWTTFHAISLAPINLNPDVVEIFGWGKHPSPGYYKHPPLGGLMAGTWFAIFPAANWAAHLLAMVNAAASLAIVDLIARRYLSNDKRLMVLLLLLLTPFYQFQSVRFASNQTLLLTWPLAVYCFIRAYESRGMLWAAAAGASAALAMLGKYFSIYLIGGLVIAALAHPERLRYLRSPSPWISIGAGLAVLAPHLIWLHATGYQPFGYATAVLGTTRLAAAATVPGYLLGAVGYVSVLLIVFAVATRARPADIVAALSPRDPDRRLLAALLWAPLALPAIFAPILSAKITSLWTMQAWFLLPILLLMSERVELRRDAAIRGAAGVAAIALIALAISPALAWIKHRQGSDDGRAYFGVVAEELTRRWRDATARPLTIVVGEQDFTAAMTFYAADHPDSVPGFTLSASPWVTAERLAREGFAAICRDEGCAAQALRLAAGHLGAVRADIEAVQTFLGAPTPPARFILVLAPPK